MRCSLLQSRPETAACLLPRDELNGSVVDLLKTAIDLLPPGFFRRSVDHLIQAANQGVDKRGANLRRLGLPRGSLPSKIFRTKSRILGDLG